MDRYCWSAAAPLLLPLSSAKFTSSTFLPRLAAIALAVSVLPVPLGPQNIITSPHRSTSYSERSFSLRYSRYFAKSLTAVVTLPQ